MRRISKFFDRVNISSIYSQHLTTFYHYEKLNFYNRAEIPSSDKWLFIILPLVLALFFILIGLRFNEAYVNVALTCLSIFAGLLFGLLSMVFGLVQENQQSKVDRLDDNLVKKNKAKIDLTKHLFINVGFSIVLSLLALMSVLLTQLYPITIILLLRKLECYNYLKQGYILVSNGVAFFLLIEFLLTLMMIIRRFNVLFINQTT